MVNKETFRVIFTLFADVQNNIQALSMLLKIVLLVLATTTNIFGTRLADWASYVNIEGLEAVSQDLCIGRFSEY